MLRFIAEAEEQIERKMAQLLERQIMEVEQCLDTFELRVLTRTSTVDLKTLQHIMESLRLDMDTILEVMAPKFEALSAEPTVDTVFVALFSASAVPPSPP